MKRIVLAMTCAFGLVASAATPALAAKKFRAPEGFTLKQNGELIHNKSETRFPLVYEGFARTNNFGFDADGKNIAVVYKYTTPAKQVVEVRIALVHILMMSAHEHFAALAPIMKNYFPDLGLRGVTHESDGAIAVKGMKDGSAWQGRFQAVRSPRVPYVMSLTTVDLGYWSARIIAAYPEALKTDAQARIAGLIDKINEHGPQHP